jgi:hypothetical protein
VNALHEFLLYGLVTLRAGGRHVEAKDRRFIVGGGQDLVRAVAIRTDRRLLCRYEEKGWALWPLASMTYFWPWQVPQVAGILAWLTRDFGSLAGNNSCGLP